MGIRLPTPRHGWRVFAGEVGTILLGVLLALGAQEFVQSLHWSREVRETRKALDSELSRDLAAYQYRVSQAKCVEVRLAELQRWVESLRSDRPLKIKALVEAPPGFKIRTAAWEVTDGEIASRIPIDAKMAYAGMYDAMRTFDEMTDTEQEEWAGLMEMQSGASYSEEDLRAIERGIRLTGAINQAIPSFAKTIDPFARELGIRPEANIEARADPIIAKWRKGICEPLL